jgi:hypothetical protein
MNKYFKGFSIIIVFTLTSICVFSQITVTGTILCEDDSLAIPGVSVTEKGTNNSIQASIDGFYTITVKDTSVLVFSFVGMVTREVPVNGQNEINTTLKQAGIYEAWDQKLRFFLNSGLIENPVGGQFEFAVPTFIDGLSLYGNCSYQTNLKENSYFDAGLKLNGVRLFYGNGFSFGVGIESNYRHILLNNSTLETISFESIWWSSYPFDLIVGYSQANNNSGIVLGMEYWIPKPIKATIKGKVSFLKELLEYQAEIRKSFGRIQSFVKYYNVDSYSELSIGLGVEFTYFFKYQRNEY